MRVSDLAGKHSCYADYRKVRGVVRAFEAGLIPDRRIWICRPDESIDLDGFPPDYRFLCRPDAPGGVSPLPRGRDLLGPEIPNFLFSVSRVCADGVLLVFEHPSIACIGRYLPRYRVDGGLVVLFSQSAGIVVEYVGPGFDVGEITRGRDVHSTVQVTWDQTAEIVSHASPMTGRRIDISHSQYTTSRHRRLKELSDCFGYDKQPDIISAIPTLPSRFTIRLGRQVVDEIVLPAIANGLVRRHELVAITLNIYGHCFYVFEAFDPESAPDVKEGIGHG